MVIQSCLAPWLEARVPIYGLSRWYGFLTTWCLQASQTSYMVTLGSESWIFQRIRWKLHFLYDQASEIFQHHFCCNLLVYNLKEYKPWTQGEGKYILPLDGGMTSSRRAYGMGDTTVAIFWKYNLPKACRLEPTLPMGLGHCQTF